MQDDSASTAAPVRTSPNGHPADAAPAGSVETLGVHTRVRHGLRRPHNWIQLFKFFVVGGSGYVVNLAVFALLDQGLGVHHLVAAVCSFCVAVTNNFLLNRHWTFQATTGHAGFQAARFFAVSVLGLGVNLLFLYLLVDVASGPELASQALAVAGAMPFNFVGNKLWTFGRGRR
jgi:dolichol-phosphate mannosyltransferase